MVALNTVVAAQLKEFKQVVDAQIEKGNYKELAIVATLRKYITESKAIRFEGNGYSQEWEEEAATRGLSNFKTTPDALNAYMTNEAHELFVGNGIFTEKEIEARFEIVMEEYVKKIQIESRIMGDLANNQAALRKTPPQQR